MKKHIKFTDGILIEVQKYADKHYAGNFTLAVNKLIEKGLLS